MRKGNAFDSTESKIIKKTNELYITNRKKYLVLDKEGNYKTIESKLPLNDGHIKQHLKGTQTIGVFSGKEISKFVCFDIDMVDVTNPNKVKWIYYLLTQCLVELGVNKEYIHVAYSGNKGLHVLLFVENGTLLENFKSLFIETMELLQGKLDSSILSKLNTHNELTLEIKDLCNIEFRPSESQGVKLELGVNFRNANSKLNHCVFLDKETLSTLPREYLLSIKPMPKDEFADVVDSVNDKYIEVKIQKEKELIKTLKEPSSHKINKDENETIQDVVNLLQNGLYTSGSRHNSTLKIATYFRYMGLRLEECIEALKEWMANQDTKYYNSPLDEALNECERLGKIVYDREYSLVGRVSNLKVHKSELQKVINIKEKNTKVIYFAMLLHSKRYALKNGVFYMTYRQIEEMCGIKIEGAMNNIKALEELGLVEIIDRNIKQDNTYIKKPNKYKMNIDDIVSDESVIEIDNSSVTLNGLTTYYTAISKLFNKKELTHLPRFQRTEINKYRKIS